MDGFFERYGWSYEQFEACPQVYIDHLPAVWAAKAAVIERKRAAEQAKQKATGR